MRFILMLLFVAVMIPQTQRSTAPETVYLLKPAHVFDGESAQLHDNWVVLVRGEKIEAAGPAGSITAPAGAKVIDLAGLTLMPGLIEAHSHVLLHPYSETVWNDQVARESLSLRVARATNHLRNTLQAGFTTVRDLGTEGAGLCRRRTQTSGGARHHPRTANDRGHEGHRRYRQLWTKGLRL
jgi:imidazolonepropionase-like amidohydrolase